MQLIQTYKPKTIVGFKHLHSDERRIIMTTRSGATGIIFSIREIFSCFTTSEGLEQCHMNHANSNDWEMYEFRTIEERSQWLVSIRPGIFII